jgi:hydrogenase-4 component F
MPLTGRGFLVAMLALIGLPPFGLFMSEVMIFGAGIRAGFALIAVAGLALLVVAFAGLLRASHRMLYGSPRPATALEPGGWGPALPVLIPLLLLVLTGVAWPPALAAALERIAAVVGY